MIKATAEEEYIIPKNLPLNKSYASNPAKPINLKSITTLIRVTIRINKDETEAAMDIYCVDLSDVLKYEDKKNKKRDAIET